MKYEIIYPKNHSNQHTSTRR